MKKRLHEIIFEADTRAGKTFDVVLIISVLISVLAVVLESVKGIRTEYGNLLRWIEWTFTALFTIEYLLRIYAVERPLKYMFSFFGIVDLLSVLPTYIGLAIPAGRPLRSIRILRVLRVFRVFKLGTYIKEINQMLAVLRASARRILIFLLAVFTLVVMLGALMYIIESEQNGFTSIPRGIYWAVVTLTTVGYGDISPQTGLGQAVAALVMILGYSIIVVPTGFVSVAAVSQINKEITTQSCPSCCREGHDRDAEYCKYCGGKL